jgi:glucosyl-dolichyl phosphate glucuronosyltransferase
MLEGATMLISICIPSYNRSHILQYCLTSLTRLQLSNEFQAEIVVIDNNSSDNTRAVVETLAKSSPIPVTYAFEGVQGASAARNRAIAIARGEYIAFLDDECVVPSDWLMIAYRVIKAESPAVIGGPYMGAFLPGLEVPRWFKQSYGDAYFVPMSFERGFQPRFKASSGNMFVRRDVFQQVQFNNNLGVKGGELKLGEEIELQEQYFRLTLGASAYYEPDLVVSHFVMPWKLSLRYRAKRLMEAGAQTKKQGMQPKAMVKGTIITALAPFRILLRDRAKYPYWQNFIYERVIPATMPHLGRALELLRRRYDPQP